MAEGHGSPVLKRVQLLPDPTPWGAPAALTPRPPLHTGRDAQRSILRGCGPVERGRRARRIVRLRRILSARRREYPCRRIQERQPSPLHRAAVRSTGQCGCDPCGEGSGVSSRLGCQAGIGTHLCPHPRGPEDHDWGLPSTCCRLALPGRCELRCWERASGSRSSSNGPCEKAAFWGAEAHSRSWFGPVGRGPPSGATRYQGRGRPQRRRIWHELHPRELKLL